MKLLVIQFRQPGKVQRYTTTAPEAKQGSMVIVETKHGLMLGKVVHTRQPNEEEATSLPAIVRLAEDKDLEQAKHFMEEETDAHTRCTEAIARHKLPMKLVKTEYTFNGGHLTFYFTADGRVDFRQLVRDLTGIFKTRVELRQIGPRDETKVVGGVGRCGRKLCCSTWLTHFSSISLDMAGNQFLGTKNTDKVTGLCGRLLCCLAYEDDYYTEQKKNYPTLRAKVKTPKGIGEVFDINIFRGIVKVKLLEDNNIIEVTPDECKHPS